MSVDGDKTTWPVIGHEQAVRDLRDAVRSGRVSHAYLITGPEGVGRTTLATVLAQALNCERAMDQRPCGECASCRRIDHGAHPDVTRVDLDWQAEMIAAPRGDASRSRQRLSIESIRWLRQDIVTRPVMGRWKVQIIDDADLLSESAPDAFLKTLEEPPPFAVIILVASSVDAVSETVRSRCRHIQLGTVSTQVIRETLEARGVPPAAAGAISRSAHGRIAWALRMASDPEALRVRREKVEAALEHLMAPLGRVEISGVIASNHSRSRDATHELLDLYAGLWRDALLHRAGLSDLAVFPEVGDRLAAYASNFEVGDLRRAVGATQRCMGDLDANMQARIALHAMVMQWPR
ncbi:MAG TPA: DNA polymerase III subunit delta' [Chloroflexota bacterium]|nr:DNA polymerase III subunit delta' [Chloroflexota bacterium]